MVGERLATPGIAYLAVTILHFGLFIKECLFDLPCKPYVDWPVCKLLSPSDKRHGCFFYLHVKFNFVKICFFHVNSKTLSATLFAYALQSVDLGCNATPCRVIPKDFKKWYL